MPRPVPWRVGFDRDAVHVRLVVDEHEAPVSDQVAVRPMPRGTHAEVRCASSSVNNRCDQGSGKTALSITRTARTSFVRIGAITISSVAARGRSVLVRFDLMRDDGPASPPVPAAGTAPPS